MNSTTQRPTPETDEATRTTDWFSGEPMVPQDFARMLERERDEAREELQAMRDERNQLSRDLSSLLAADCLNGHDAVEGVRNGIAMREAIKEAHEALMLAPYRDQEALAKLKPFIKP